MTDLAERGIRPGSFVRLAPGVEVERGTSARCFVVRYGTTARGELELPAGEPHLVDVLATLAQRNWTPVSELGDSRAFDSTAGLLAVFLNQDWLQLAEGKSATTTRVIDGTMLADVIREMVVAAADSLELAGVASFTEALLDICQPWKSRQLSEPPPWSGLTLDLTPFEFSANFDGSGVQLRFVAEPQSNAPSATTYWDSAMSVGRNLHVNWKADIGRLQAVEDLFAPGDPQILLSAFYGVGIGRGRSLPNFKVYLSPSAAARGSESQVIARACERLGLSETWAQVRDSGPREFLWTLVCLDLDHGPDARFKIYETLADTESTWAARLQGTAIENSAAALSAALPPSLRGLDWGFVSYTLKPNGEVSHTFGLPVSPGAQQGLVRQKIEALFSHLGIDSRPYRRFFRAVGAVCNQPVEHTYVTIQQVAGMPRITTYVAPRIYQARFGVFEEPVWPSPVPSFSLGGG